MTEDERRNRARIRARIWASNNPERRAAQRAIYAARPGYVEGNRKRAREWYHKNKNRVRARQIANAEVIRRDSKKWREQNRERISAMQLAWRIKNKRHRARYQRRYCKTAHGKLVFINAAARRRARLRGVVSKATAKQIERLLKCARKCHYCGRQFNKRRRKTVDHIVPISRGGAHAIENMLVCCLPCNSTKKDKHPTAFAREIGRLLI